MILVTRLMEYSIGGVVFNDDVDGYDLDASHLFTAAATCHVRIL